MKISSRREFLGLLGTGAAVLALAACGKSSGYGDSSGGASVTGSLGDGQCGNGASTLYTNPGHAHTTINVTGDQMQAAQAGVYTLLGGSHFHTFQLSADDFNTLQSGKIVTKTDLEGHGHILEISC